MNMHVAQDMTHYLEKSARQGYTKHSTVIIGNTQVQLIIDNATRKDQISQNLNFITMLDKKTQARDRLRAKLQSRK